MRSVGSSIKVYCKDREYHTSQVGRQSKCKLRRYYYRETREREHSSQSPVREVRKAAAFNCSLVGDG